MAFNVMDSAKYQAWLTSMLKDGLIPPEVRRVIIDAPIDGSAKVYYECNADDRMFNIELAELVKGAAPISVNDMEARPNG